MSFIPLPPGAILAYAGRIAPNGWLLCDGSDYSKAMYPELWQALIASDLITGIYDTQINATTGTAWAAPVSSNFRVPDFRGLFLRGAGTASGGDASTLGAQQTQKTAKNSLSVSNAQSSVSVSGLKNQMNNSSFSVSGNKNQMNNSVSVTGAKSPMDGTTGGQSANHYHPQFVVANPNTGSIDGRYDFTQDVFTDANGKKIYMNAQSQTSTGVASADHSHAIDFGTATFSASGSWDFGTATFSASGSWDFGGSALFSASGTAVAQVATVTGDNETRPVNKGVNYIIKV